MLITRAMSVTMAALPILSLLVLMIALRLGGHVAGPLSWLVCLAASLAAFGISIDVFVISQLKSLTLSFYVVSILWAALLLYNIVNARGGIRGIAEGLRIALGNDDLLKLVLAWCFSGIIEGIYGFGLPIAVVAPLLVSLGISPVRAVLAVAVGHCWSITFGDMGIIYQTLLGITKMDPAVLSPITASVMSIVCIGCGFAVLRILGLRCVWEFALLSAVMVLVQYVFAVTDLSPLAGFFASCSGLLAGALLGKLRYGGRYHKSMSREMLAGLFSYGSVSVLIAAVTLIPSLRFFLESVVWKASFPAVTTAQGFHTAACFGTPFKPLVNPGVIILLIACVAYAVFRISGTISPGSGKTALRETFKAAFPATITIASTIGISSLMDYSGMTILLARHLADTVGSAFPVVSPLIGIIGAFATGSNNSSNVIFAGLQLDAAKVLQLDERLIVSLQTAGGSLGSMLSPAKLAVGCATVGAKGSESDVLRISFPIGILMGLLLGGIGFLLNSL